MARLRHFAWFRSAFATITPLVARLRGVFATTCLGGGRQLPEGLARPVHGALVVSEIHPFEDGNGRLSCLTVNAGLSRLGLHRSIIPTRVHPHDVPCQRALTRTDEPDGPIEALAFAARWCSGFDCTDVPSLIAALRATHAFEESPTQCRLVDHPDDRKGYRT